MRVCVLPAESQHEREFLAAVSETVQAAGNKLVAPTERRDVTVVWNGKAYRATGPTLVVELGWIPRGGSYQVSWRGINAEWAGLVKPLPDGWTAEAWRERCQADQGKPWKYLRRDLPIPKDLPDRFALLPLQISTDLNMRQVPTELRSPQSLYERVCRDAGALPVVVFEHPAQRQPRKLREMRPADRFLERDGNGPTIYGLLASGKVAQVYTLNSNSYNDATLYGVPAKAYGRGIWSVLPKSPSQNDYIENIYRRQWTPEDAKDPQMVTNALRGALSNWTAPTDMGLQVVNVIADNRGWLFEDLKARYLEIPGVVVSDVPFPGADAYMYLRPEEAVRNSPDLARTICQVHDLNGGPRLHRFDELKAVPGWVCAHPDQLAQLDKCRVLSGRRIMLQPLSAPAVCYETARHHHGVFRVGWIGRASVQKHVERLIDACARMIGDVHDLRLCLLGEGLAQFENQAINAGIKVELHRKSLIGYARYPELYSWMDAVCITSDNEAGPLCLYEALAAGVPVVSRDVGWAGRLIIDGINGYVCGTDGIAAKLLDIATSRRRWHAREKAIRGTAPRHTLEHWLQWTVDFARECVGC